MKIKHLAIVFCFLLSANSLQAQEESRYGLPKPKTFDRWSIGLHGGISHLFSDYLKGEPGENDFFGEGDFNPAFGLSINHQVSHTLGLRLRGMYTTFGGTDQEKFSFGGGTPIPYNTEFETDNIEGTLEMLYNFGNISFLSRNPKFHLVFSIGVGLMSYDPVVRVTDITTGAEVAKADTLNDTQFIFPFGLGFKYRVGNRIDLGLSFDYRKTFNDKIDGTYKSLSEDDNYMYALLNINFLLGKKNNAMEWVNPMGVVYNDLAQMREKVDALSGDKDKDGVSDLFDKDNSTPEGIKVYGDGTAVDTDGDGIPDSKDADPYSLKGASVDANGKEMDGDNDGVGNSRDLEPNTEAGSLVNFQGVTIAKAGKFGKDGVSGTSGQNGAAFLPSVYFDLGSSSISASNYDKIAVVGMMLKKNPDLKLTLVGNTDKTGGAESNNRLGLRRAENVRDHLVRQYGIDASRLQTESRGEADPLANNLNSVNRRVDFVVK